MNHTPDPPSNEHLLEELLRSVSDNLLLAMDRLAIGAERQSDHLANLADQRTATLERIADALTHASESVNAREFARIADKSEARLNGYAGAGGLALVLALLAATQVRLPVWNGRIPGWIAALSAWTAAAYDVVALLIAVTRLFDTRVLLTSQVHRNTRRHANREQATGDSATPAAAP